MSLFGGSKSSSTSIGLDLIADQEEGSIGNISGGGAVSSNGIAQSAGKGSNVLSESTQYVNSNVGFETVNKDGELILDNISNSIITYSPFGAGEQSIINGVIEMSTNVVEQISSVAEKITEESSNLISESVKSASDAINKATELADNVAKDVQDTIRATPVTTETGKYAQIISQSMPYILGIAGVIAVAYFVNSKGK
jgi:hypothetical protein